MCSMHFVASDDIKEEEEETNNNLIRIDNDVVIKEMKIKLKLKSVKYHEFDPRIVGGCATNAIRRRNERKNKRVKVDVHFQKIYEMPHNGNDRSIDGMNVLKK